MPLQSWDKLYTTAAQLWWLTRVLRILRQPPRAVESQKGLNLTSRMLPCLATGMSAHPQQAGAPHSHSAGQNQRYDKRAGCEEAARRDSTFK